MIRMAFLYRVNNGDIPEKYFVKIARCITYAAGNVAWMEDCKLPAYDAETDTGTLVPDVDLTEVCHEFITYPAAMVFIAEHYQSELAKMRDAAQVDAK